jgi:general secretion pathway protein M
MSAAVNLPTGSGGRPLALAILGLMLALLYLAIVSPLVDLYQAGEAKLADRQLLASRLARAAAELPALRTRLAQLQATGTARDIALEGASDALASANLQSRVEQLAAANGVTVTSTEAIPPEDRGRYRRIGLRLTLSGPYEAVVKLLAAVEEAQPPIVVGNLQMHGLVRAIEVRANHPLDTRFEVYGFRVNAPAAPSQ